MNNNGGNVIEMRVINAKDLPALLAQLSGKDIVADGGTTVPTLNAAQTFCEMLADAIEHDDPVKIDLEKGIIQMRDGTHFNAPKFTSKGTKLVTGQVRTEAFEGEDGSFLAATSRSGRLTGLSDGTRELDLLELYTKRQAEKENQEQTNTTDQAPVEEHDNQEQGEAKTVFKLHGRPIELGQLLFVVTDRVFLERVYEADSKGNILSALVRHEFDGPNDDPTHIPAENLLFRPVTQATLEKCRNAAPKQPRARYRFTLANLGSFVTEELYDNDKHLIRTLKDRGIDASMGLSNVERLRETETW